MSTSGQAHEGWMALIPLCVLCFIVMVALGGPESFVNTVANLATDGINYAVSWLRHF